MSRQILRELLAPRGCLFPCELASYAQFPGRVWMHLVEVLEGRRHMCDHSCLIARVYVCNLTALERVDEALDHILSMPYAYRRVGQYQAQRKAYTLVLATKHVKIAIVLG